MSFDLTKKLLRYRASSIMNNFAEFATKHMFDDSNETCWNSDQGTSQYILLEFDEDVCVSNISLIFQGGFVGQDGIIEVGKDINNMKTIVTLECIDDSNEEQIFPLNQTEYNKLFKITFNSSTDFYGRITIYKFRLYGDISK